MTQRPEDQPGDRTPEDAAPEDAAPEQAAPEQALRAADPAAAADLDLTALRAEVDRRIAAETAPGVEDEHAVVTPIRTRRPARWLQVAAAVAALAVVGGGSYAIGASGDGSTATPAAAPAISLQGSAAGAQEAAGAADSLAATTDMRIAPYYGGRTVFTASGLSDEAGTGHGWALDAAATFSAETASRVAGALGVTGEPRLEWGAWTVGPNDGSGPTVSVQSDGTTGVSYYDPTRDPWSCTVSGTDTPDAATSSGSADGAVAIDPVVPTCDPAAAPAPTGDAALGMARDAMSSLGVDPASFALTVEDSGDQTQATTVTAAHVVDGQQTGLTWSFTLVADGVQSLYGFLAPLVDLGGYPVIGAASAVERLGDPRFGPTSGGVMPLARAEAADAAASTMIAPEPSDEPTVPGTVQPGAAIDWPVQQVTITSARLGVSLITQADGAALLVPAYELTGSDGSVWSVIAVAEDSLDLG